MGAETQGLSEQTGSAVASASSGAPASGGHRGQTRQALRQVGYSDGAALLSPRASAVELPVQMDASSAPDGAPGARRMVRLDDQGPDVADAQALLNAHGATPPLDVDSYFGEKTQKAVYLFQSGHALDPDCIIGPLTWNELEQGQAPPQPVPPLPGPPLPGLPVPIWPCVPPVPVTPGRPSRPPPAHEHISGNPRDVQPNAERPGTVHAAPRVDQAANWKAGAPAPDVRQRYARPVATESCPAVGLAPPSQSALWEERPAEEPGFAFVHGTYGTTAQPIVAPGQIEPGPIFLDGGPKSADVTQGYIADCYFLSAVMSIAEEDPGKILSTITPDGAGGAHVIFHRRVPETGQFHRVAIHVSGDLAQITAPPGQQTQLKGAKFNVERSNSRWWTQVTNNVLFVNRKDDVRGAMWVPLLEKAYARFTEVYGQSGGAYNSGPYTSKGGPGSQGSGYEMIDNGFAGMTYPLFYGAEGYGKNLARVDYVPDAGDLCVHNRRAVLGLALASGKGVGAGEAALVTAAADIPDHLWRYNATVEPLVIKGAAPWLSPPTRNALAGVYHNAKAHLECPPQQKKLKKDTLVASSKSAQGAIHTPSVNSELGDPSKPKKARDVSELLASVSTASGEWGGNAKNIYGAHEYDVVSAGFITRQGEPVAWGSPLEETSDSALNSIDINASSVMIRNPHHGNSPDPLGRRVGQPDSGLFELTLDQFFRSFSNVTAGKVKKTGG